MKMKSYMVFNLFLPLIIIIVMPILIFIFCLNYFELNEISLLFLTLKVEENIDIPSSVEDIFIFVMLIVIFSLIFILLRKLNKNRVFAPEYIESPKYYIFYKLAKLIGFKKISLQKKPYFIIFHIIINNDFKEFYGLRKENEDLSQYLTIRVDDSRYHISSNEKECNIVVSDVYKIKKKQLPRKKQNLETIVITREGYEGVKVYSKKLVNEVRNSLIKILPKVEKINFFLTTSTYTTYEIVCECLTQLEIGKIKIEVFEQNLNGYFDDKGKIVF